MVLNTLTGRSFNDLRQYPVFPHIVADHTSPELDTSQLWHLRNLSKPMGVQHPSRVTMFQVSSDHRLATTDGVYAC